MRRFGPADYQSLRFYIGDTTFATIVGVVSDIRNGGPFAPAEPEVYYPYDLGNRSSTSYAIAVRANSGDPTALEAEVRAAIPALDPGAAVSGMMSMNDAIARSMGQPRFYLTLLGVFALVAVVLALAGLYGVMSYAVTVTHRRAWYRATFARPSCRCRSRACPASSVADARPVPAAATPPVVPSSAAARRPQTQR